MELPLNIRQIKIRVWGSAWGRDVIHSCYRHTCFTLWSGVNTAQPKAGREERLCVTSPRPAAMPLDSWCGNPELSSTSPALCFYLSCALCTGENSVLCSFTLPFSTLNSLLWGQRSPIPAVNKLKTCQERGEEEPTPGLELPPVGKWEFSGVGVERTVEDKMKSSKWGVVTRVHPKKNDKKK